MPVALHDRQTLAAGIVHPRVQPHDPAEAALKDLFLGPQETVLVAARIADMQADPGFLAHPDHLVGIFERDRDRFLDENLLARLEGGDRCVAVQSLRRRHDDRVDFRIVDQAFDIGGNDIGVDVLAERLSGFLGDISDADETHRRVG